MRGAAVLTVAGAVPALVGGAIFWAVHRSTSFPRALAYGLWVAAAVLLVAMLLANTGQAWRRTSFAIPESWVFSSAAAVLTVFGILVDLAGG